MIDSLEAEIAKIEAAGRARGLTATEIAEMVDDFVGAHSVALCKGRDSSAEAYLAVRFRPAGAPLDPQDDAAYAAEALADVEDLCHVDAQARWITGGLLDWVFYTTLAAAAEPGPKGDLSAVIVRKVNEARRDVQAGGATIEEETS